MTPGQALYRAGSFNLRDAARAARVDHLLMASTSSVYGANTAMPFAKTDKTGTPVTIHAATKKANEAMAHAYADLVRALTGYRLQTDIRDGVTAFMEWYRPEYQR